MSRDGGGTGRPYFRLLGPLAVDLDGRPLHLGGRLGRALLADLALHANEVLSIDRLVDDLWGERPPRDPLNTIQVYIGQLRRILEPARGRREAARLIVSTRPGYELVVDEGALDMLAFEALVGAGHTSLSTGDLVRGAESLREALSLWRGDPLPEFADASFARGRLARLADLHLTALEARIEADLAVGEPHQVVGELEALTSEHPLRERLWELNMLALYRAGRPAEALRSFQQARRVLVDELGLEPGPRLQILEQRIMRRDPDLDAPRRHAVPVAMPPVSASSERFVGRTVELARLESLLAEAITGTRVVALVTAEAGLGKSRLVAELATRAWARGCLVVSGRCFEGEAGAPFAPILECVSELARAVDPVAFRKNAERAAAIVARLLPELHEVLGELPEPDALPGEEDRARLFDGVSRLLIAGTRLAPTVLVLDDLHWADVSTLGLASYVARAAHGAPLMIIACCRPDEIDAATAHGRAFAAFEREGRATTISLGPMTDVEASQLVHDVLGDGADATAVAQIVQGAAGHPFFLRELAREALDGTRDGGNIPAGARDLVLQRVHRLAPDCRRLLAAASVFDEPFDLTTAATAAEQAGEQALDALDALILAGLVIPTGDGDQFEFVHDLARRAIYSTFTAPRRARLHRRVATAIEQRGSDEERLRAAASLARHYALSMTLPGKERGAIHAERAAAAAETAHAYSEAVRMLELAVDLLPADDSALPRLLGRLGEARIAAGEEAAGLAALLEAAPRVAVSEGRHAAAEMLAQAATHAVQRGAWTAGSEVAAAGLAHLDEDDSATWARLRLAQVVTSGINDPAWPGIILGTPDQLRLSGVLRGLPASERPPGLSSVLLGFESRHDVLATVPHEPAALAMWAGEYARAGGLAGPTADDDEEAGRIESAIVHRCVEARCLNALGHFPASDVAFERGASLLRRLVRPSLFATHLLMVDEERWAARGEEWGRFRVDLRGSLDPRALHWYAVARRVSAARVLAHTGSADEAIEHLAPVLHAIDAAPAWTENYVRILHSAAEVHWITGRDDHASLIERNIRQKVLEPDFRYPMTDLRLSLARLVVVQGRLDEAAHWFAQAREVLDEQQALPLRTVVDCDEGVVEARLGHAGAAHALLTAAGDRAAALGMHGWARMAASAAAALASRS